ncbi:MAG TPA: hypothetical protein VKF32_03570 [Thermoanaerobaculia bacterium]|nr:hypothetical protein [Thermoanaerobaculia bacterium]
MSGVRRACAVVCLYGALALLMVPVFPHFQSPNELTRWATAAALVEHGTFEVSSVLPLLAPGFEDLAVKDGRTFSNKAPGGALVALPGYLAARLFSPAETPASMRPQVNAMRLVASTLPALALALLVVASAERFGRGARAPFLVLVLLFGTPLFAYGLLLFSHALVACCLFGAWAALFLPGGGRSAAARDLAAGALVGLATFSEYAAAVPGLVLLVCAAPRLRLAGVLRVALGGLPFAVALGLYDLACFGNAFRPSYRFEKLAEYRAVAGAGFFGIHFPSLDVLARLLADPSKGLLVFSPVLLLWGKGFVAARRTLSVGSLCALALVPASILLLYAGYPNWHGGWTVGPRYVLPAVPFLVLPLAFLEGGFLEAVLTGASVLAVAMTSLVFPFVPGDFPLPWGTFAWPLLRHGSIAPDLLHLVAPALAIAVPWLLVAAALAAGLAARRLAGAALGAALCLAVGSIPRDILSRRVERAYVEEVYFEREGALGRVFGPVPLPPSLVARRERELRLGPTRWPIDARRPPL